MAVSIKTQSLSVTPQTMSPDAVTPDSFVDSMATD